MSLITPGQASASTQIDACGEFPRLMGLRQAEYRLVLLTQLRHQSRFPCQILFHRLAVAGVAIVHEEQVIDAFGVGWNIGRRCRRMPGCGPCFHAAVEQADIRDAGINQFCRGQPCDIGIIGDQNQRAKQEQQEPFLLSEK